MRVHLDESGSDAVDGDPRRERHGEAAGEMDQRRLARRIGDATATRRQARDRRDVDNATGALLPEEMRGRERGQEESARAGGVDPSPECRCGGVECGERGADDTGGVVYE